MKKLLVMLLMLGLSMVLLAGCGSSGIGGNIIKDEGALVRSWISLKIWMVSKGRRSRCFRM